MRERRKCAAALLVKHQPMMHTANLHACLCGAELPFVLQLQRLNMVFCRVVGQLQAMQRDGADQRE